VGWFGGSLEASFEEPFAEAVAGAEEQGSGGGFGAVEEGGDLGVGELVDGGEEEGVAFGGGKAVDLAESCGDLAGFGEGLVGGGGGGDEGVGEERVHLVGTDAAATVEGEVPGDADEPDAVVADGWELVLVFQDADEGVLHDVFGLCAVTQDGVGDAEEQSGVGFHEGCQIGGRSFSFRGSQCQVPVLYGCCVCHLLGQTGEGWICSEVFWRARSRE
jgi:hypothetical protein